jgi:O-antigen/teichoic acid export membrane protein
MAEFAAQRLDSLAVGHLVGAKALGEYQMAFRLGEMPATEVANSARIISFSMVSRPRFASHRERLFAFFMGIVALVGIAYVLFIAKWGSWLIVTAVGAKWLGSVRPLKWLCLYGLGRGLMSIGTGFLDGLGVPDSSFRVTLFGAVVLAVLVYPLTLWFGTVGAAAAVVTSVAVALPLMLKMYWDAGSQLKPAGAE